MTEALGRIITVINNKGGVGKTTITRELAAALARRGRRVLCVDMDPQANLTRRLAAKLTDGATLTDILAHPVTKGGAAKAIVRCGWDTPEAANIQVLPSDLELEDRANAAEASQPGADGRLRRVLFGVVDEHDYTLIDCRPALGHLEQLAVATLNGDDDGVLVVIEPGADAISGAARVIDRIREWADRLDITVPILGVITNLVMEQTLLHRGRIENLERSLAADDETAPPILTPFIPRAIKVAEAQDLGLPASTDGRLRPINELFDQLAERIDITAEFTITAEVTAA